jgi:hypothetical protein
MAYRPNIPPSFETLEDTRVWVREELERISTELSEAEEQLGSASSGSGSGGGGTALAVATISVLPPPSPVVGQLWWKSNMGNLFIWYDDGTSSQWVPAMAGFGSPAPMFQSSVFQSSVFQGL